MKNQSFKSTFHRRSFLKGIVPVSLGLASLNSFGASSLLETEDPVGHKFDKIPEKQMSYRETIELRFKEFIKTMKAIKEEWGSEKTIVFLETNTDKRSFRSGEKMLKKSDDNSFATYTSFLDNPFYENTLTFEYVEKSDKVLEIKVTECIWATTFLKNNVGDIGHAHVCTGDFSHCQGFNPKIKLIRTKTLMQGDAYCNHRYILEE
jgi:hypothetical protein